MTVNVVSYGSQQNIGQLDTLRILRISEMHSTKRPVSTIATFLDAAVQYEPQLLCRIGRLSLIQIHMK